MTERHRSAEGLQETLRDVAVPVGKTTSWKRCVFDESGRRDKPDNVGPAKAQRYLKTDWEPFRSNPDFDLLVEYKDNAFRPELPEGLPVKRDVEHRIDVKDANIAMYRQQWRQSPEARHVLSADEVEESNDVPSEDIIGESLALLKAEALPVIAVYQTRTTKTVTSRLKRMQEAEISADAPASRKLFP
ncbi:hypothetical protein PC117_g18976 [Phytophthora cactorum]|uniref:Uncharacterized protein n=1 Tax=Phytophthora cactorum TaxID=29920 RepID=A0A8T1BZZ8_9STRA|nr:hypothetical protein PC117_g18976 [Phytophthora cactorum]